MIAKFQFEPNSILAMLIFTTLVYGGVNLIFFQGASISKKASRFVLINIKNDFDRAFDNSEIKEEFIKAGFKTFFIKHYKKYQLVRYIIFAMTLSIFIAKSLTMSISISPIAIFTILFFISSPKLKIYKYWTIFGHAMKAINKEYKRKQDIELSSIVVQLQNIAISQKNEPTTLTNMLSRVVRFSYYTKAAFVSMISYLDQGREEYARDAFINEIDTNIGRDLAYILIELDRIEPSEVVNQLKLLEESVRKENLTHKTNSEEFYSNLMYIFPTLLCFIILLNFLMIILNLVTSNITAF